jgi:hypothetical protein
MRIFFEKRVQPEDKILVMLVDDGDVREMEVATCLETMYELPEALQAHPSGSILCKIQKVSDL